MSNWRKEVDAQSDYIKLETGIPFKGKFLGAEFIDHEKYGRMLRCMFKTELGSEKSLDTASKRLQGRLKDIPEGTLIEITRFGEGFDTHYEVSVVAKKEVDKVVEETANQVGGTETINEEDIKWD